MRRVEIVPNHVGGFAVGDKEYQVSPSCDLVVRFVDPELDHLRYAEPDGRGITLHWLGQSVMASLVGFGIPETRKRLKMEESEYDDYITWLSERMDDFEADI